MSSTAAAADKTESLDDLLVEGEMYQQYQLAARLRETLEKIDRLYPGADAKNDRVRELYEAAGYVPKFKPPAPAVVPAAGGEGTSPAATASQSLKSPPTYIVNQLRKECSRWPSMRLGVV
jgi:hypothetical protein